jgi:hypothetical protein
MAHHVTDMNTSAGFTLQLREISITFKIKQQS